MKNTILFTTFLVLLLSCQEVKIEETDAGVYFRKFGGGVDTSKVFEPGIYTIPTWDYIKTYNTQVHTGMFKHPEKEDAVFTVNFKFQLIKEKLGSYHAILGGSPEPYVVRIIKENLQELDLSKATQLDNFSEIEQGVFQKCTSALAQRGYISLKELKIRPTQE